MSLLAHLHERIALEGPLPLDRYMALCLGHPRDGYYTTREPFGTAGDFTTAPEISQMFGELLGLWAGQAWLDRGAPKARLVEIGPGRGTLMRDALRALKAVPGFIERVGVHLVETSPRLRDVQRETLAGHEVRWHERLDEVPSGPLFLLANELFDALPVRQFVFENGWRERLVGSDGAALGWGLGAEPEQIALPRGLAPPRTGDVFEIAPGRDALAVEIGTRIAREGGAALIVDYGHVAPCYGDTFQAVRRHETVDPLKTPGEADLTSHVDFAALASAAARAGAIASPVVGQGVLLAGLGIEARANALIRANPAHADAVIRAATRLTSPDEMGTLFKTLALHAPGAPPPPGFGPASQKVR